MSSRRRSRTSASQSQGALETLRDLARGIYPAVLSDGGLIRRSRRRGGKSPMPVEVAAEGIGRYPQDVEAAVYFCCLEALQNAAKYADASSVLVRLEDGPVTRSALPSPTTASGSTRRPSRPGSGTRNMQDRLAAIGGGIVVRSRPGAGTTVEGWVPVTSDATLAAVG